MLSDPDPDLARLIRQAMLQPTRYLAAALAEIPDEELTAAIRAHPGRVWRLRLCEYPDPEHWATEIARMARMVDGDAARLGALLQRAGRQP